MKTRGFCTAAVLCLSLTLPPAAALANDSAAAPEKEIPASEPAPVQSVEYTDVSRDSCCYDAVLWAAGRGITSGTTPTTFSPGEPCTRGQLAVFLWRAAGSPVVNYAMAFSDVSDDSPYAEAIRWAASLGIAAGCGSGAFGADDPITREQTAVILYRFAKAQGMDTTQGGMAVREYDDFDQVSAFAGEAMGWAVESGILKGSGNRLMPRETCTRAQIVTLLFRLFQGK